MISCRTQMKLPDTQLKRVFEYNSELISFFSSKKHIFCPLIRIILSRHIMNDVGSQQAFFMEKVSLKMSSPFILHEKML